MIDEALALIRQELVTYLSANGYSPSDANDIVVVENIGLFESTTSGVNLDDKIVLTLFNIEEEKTLKNTAFVKKGLSGLATYQNPPVFLNLYVLISACNKSTVASKNYLDALSRLSLIIQFFQGKNAFSMATASFYDPAKFDNDQVLNLKITAEIYSLSFEQINYVWGTLGGKQMPFVMYKFRLVAIAEGKLLREVPLIEEIETNLANRS